MKKIMIIILTAVFIVNLAGCSQEVDNRKFDKDSIDSNVTGKNAEFAFDIFKELNKEDANNNIFISPLSISTALTMTYNGADGKTKEDMTEALKYAGIDITEINETYKNLLPYLSQIDKNIDLDISNSIWYRLGEPIEEEFINDNKEIFNAEVNELDFSQESAADTINEWIERSTKGKIEKMINPPISPDVVMYLINAVYFKGDWTHKFNKKDTYSTAFKNIDNEDEDIQMMNRVSTVDYGEGEDYKAVRLPYGDKKINMYFILPEGDEEINNFIQDLDNSKFNEIRKSITEKDNVELNIPKYKLEYGIKNLNNVLAKMGMGSAFEYNADFSKIREGIFISKVLHKAVVEVNEEGSEAAGATVVEINESAVLDPLSFTADRPFVFLIMDEETGTILFMGKYCRK